ncbi:MAG: hypothetical protein GDA51_01795 [Ekhidna sp.]|nr:hypothetical protein [Ekhidna sp.]
MLTPYERQLQEWVSNYAAQVPVSAGAALATPGDSIAAVRRKAGHEALNAALAVLIGDAMELTGQGGLHANKIATLGKVIKSKYFHLRLSEIAMVLQRGIAGEYGKVPGGTNPLLYWIARYDGGERTDYCAARATSHREPYEKYFEAQDRKEIQAFRQQVKEQVKRKRAAALAEEVANKNQT